MKKIIFILSILLILASCGATQNEIDNAKQELLGGNGDEIKEKITDSVSTDSETKAKSLVQIISLDANSPLSFDSISEDAFSTGEVVISGTILNNGGVDSIEVYFTNPTSKYPDDRYILQAFKSGDSTFKYVASSKNQVLDFGQNEYVFTAYSGTSENQTKIILEVPNKDEIESTGVESNLIGVEDNTILIELPTSSKYGEPMKLGEASFTYTQIKGLEINKEILDIVSCDTLTDYLTERMTSWYYWNTCRDIVKDKGIKFNVIRLNGEQYIYERHYIDFIHGFYGVYEIETGEGVTSETIADKNTELKDREFPSLDIVDDLMKDIVNI